MNSAYLKVSSLSAGRSHASRKSKEVIHKLLRNGA